MSAIIMDGNTLAKAIKKDITEKVSSMYQKPGLAVILVGNDPASQLYVNLKKKDCEECGIKSFDYKLDGPQLESRTIDLIRILNRDEHVDGILIQLPLPHYIDTQKVLHSIIHVKDVDAFTDISMGSLILGINTIAPCTPSGIMRLLDEYNIDPSGKKCVIVNRSNIIGKPLSMMLTHRDATVTLCNSHTPNLAVECATADILITATGGGIRITPDCVKEGAVIIDASTNRDENGKLCGDVIMSNEIMDKVSYITPVPGGVGPMTRAMLLHNTYTIATKYFNKK